ncbi:NB-ARC domain-containing protein [Pseudofrankia sp. BMG5.37]|uniref:NB-ARC domain-containing protein n=1 Tax=Pseudofrankia sp. BMG5.37 TaxID=3050035 RepID=UPI002895797F|nr:NB-ARC domain-containing protein [Pseudofrankia sp. BMG5.37]MDT3444013.1 NB-ARC domain-containing protein [Pseudofrankia sp. BMG5.37]
MGRFDLGVVFVTRAILQDATGVDALRLEMASCRRTTFFLMDSCRYEMSAAGAVFSEALAFEWSSVGDAISRLNLSPPGDDDRSRRDSPPGDRSSVWNNAPLESEFVGRSGDVARVTELLREKTFTVLVVAGIGGVGKTALTLHCAKAEEESFDHVAWVSMHSMPTIDQLAQYLDGAIPEGDTSGTAHRLDATDRIVGRLTRWSTLLILDNFESILDVGVDVGRYREGFEDYEDLLTRLVAAAGRSVVLITSREEPDPVPLLRRRSERVEVYQLGGLQPDDVRDLVSSMGLVPAPEQLVQLHAAYAGNIFGLQLAVSYIVDVLSSDVDTFINDQTFVFGGVRRLIEGHLRRIGDLELRVLTWLALARAPLSTSQLVRRMAMSDPADVSGAVSNLLRRSLAIASHGGADVHELIRGYLVQSFIAKCVEEVQQGDPWTNLDDFCIVDGRRPDYVRSAQRIQNLVPIAERLQRIVSKAHLAERLEAVAESRRSQGRSARIGFSITNMLLLRVQLELPTDRLDLHGTAVVAARLDEIDLRGCDLSDCAFVDCTFSDNFGAVTSVAWSPDGTRFVAGTFDGRLRVWTSTGRQVLANVQAHKYWISAIRFVGNSSSLVALSSMDGSASLWNLDEPKRLREWKAHSRAIRDLSVSASGGVAVTVGEDGFLSAWLIPDCVQIYNRRISDSRLKVVSFVAGRDDRVVVGGDDGKLVEVDLEGVRPTRLLIRTSSWIRSLKIVSTGLAFAGCDDGAVLSFDPLEEDADPVVIGRHSSRVWAIDYDPSNGLLATAGHDATIHLWDVNNAAVNTRTLHAHTSWVRAISFSPSGDELLSAGEDQSIKVWESGSGLLTHSIVGYAQRSFSVVLSPPMLLSTHGSHTVCTWDLATNSLVQILPGHHDQVFKIAPKPGRLSFASGSDDGQVLVWSRRDVDDLLTLKLRLTHHRGWIGSLAFDVSGQRLATGADDKRIVVVDSSTGEILDDWIAHGGRVSGLFFLPDGKILSCSEDGTAAVWLLGLPEPVFRVDGRSGPLYALATDGGDRFYTGGSDGVVRQWSLDDGRLEAEYASELKRQIWSVAVDTPRSMLYSGGDDGVIRSWSIGSLECSGRLRGHVRQVWCVAVDSESGTLASAGEDGTIRIWDAEQGRELRRLQSPGRYENTRIAGAEGISLGQIRTLESLGAVR